MISTSGACENTSSWFFFKKLRLFHNPLSSQSKQLFFKIKLLLNQPQPAQVNVKCFIQLKKTHTLHISLHVHEYGMQ